MAKARAIMSLRMADGSQLYANTSESAQMLLDHIAAVNPTALACNQVQTKACSHKYNTFEEDAVLDSSIDSLPESLSDPTLSPKLEMVDLFDSRDSEIPGIEIPCTKIDQVLAVLSIVLGDGHWTQHADASVQTAEIVVTSLACQTIYTVEVIPETDVQELCRRTREDVAALRAQYKLFKSRCHCKDSSIAAANIDKDAKNKSKKK